MECVFVVFGVSDFFFSFFLEQVFGELLIGVRKMR